MLNITPGKYTANDISYLFVLSDYRGSYSFQMTVMERKLLVTLTQQQYSMFFFIFV